MYIKTLHPSNLGCSNYTFGICDNLQHMAPKEHFSNFKGLQYSEYISWLQAEIEPEINNKI